MKLNVSIDDVSPHPLSSTRVLDRCFELINIFPEIKFSLFVPISYWRTIKLGVATKHPMPINQFPDFCEILKSLPSTNFEICYHGLFHGIPNVSDNDEFQHLDKQDAIKKFNDMFSIVSTCNLQNIFKPIFRPPAWRMSPGSIQAAKEVGIQILALSPKEYAKKTYCGEENNFPKVVYYDCNPPFDELKEKNKVEIVYHACEWDRNFLDIEKTKNLMNFIQTHNDKIKFCFLGDL